MSCIYCNYNLKPETFAHLKSMKIDLYIVLDNPGNHPLSEEEISRIS